MTPLITLLILGILGLGLFFFINAMAEATEYPEDINSRIHSSIRALIPSRYEHQQLLNKTQEAYNSIQKDFKLLENPNPEVTKMVYAQLRTLVDKIASEKLLIEMINRKEYLLNQGLIELRLIDKLKQNALNQQDASQISRNYEQLSADISVLLNVDYDAEILKRLKGTSNQNEYEFEHQRLLILKDLENETDQELRHLNRTRS